VGVVAAAEFGAAAGAVAVGGAAAAAHVGGGAAFAKLSRWINKVPENCDAGVSAPALIASAWGDAGRGTLPSKKSPWIWLCVHEGSMTAWGPRGRGRCKPHPVCPDKRTCEAISACSAWGHHRTHAPQQTASLFDHFVCKGKQRGRYGKTERIRGLTINDEVELCRQLDG
jgi:hypothetical protein